MIYELRIYTIFPGRMEAIRRRFTSHTFGIFERLGMQVCDFWEELDGQPKLCYVMQYESMEERNRLWQVFQTDPEWIDVKQKSEADGKIVEKVDMLFMRRADYFKQKDL